MSLPTLQRLSTTFIYSLRTSAILQNRLPLLTPPATTSSAAPSFSTSASTSNSIGVVGIPLSKGQRKSGVEQGPDDLRNFGLLNSLLKTGHDINDYGNLEFTIPEAESTVENVKRPRTVGDATSQVADAVEKSLRENDICLNLGGDHSVAIGTLSGTSRVHPDFCVLWVDAHANINTPKTSNSGNLHGMPLSFLLHDLKEKGLAPEGLPGFEWVKTCLDAKSLAYIGLRDVDSYERLFIESLGIKVIEIKDIDTHGIEACVDDALNAINPGMTRPLHVSFDIDALDPNYAPSTGTPVREGLTIRESLYIADRVSKSGCLRTLDIVEVNLSLGKSCEGERTLLTASSIVTNHVKSLNVGRLNKMQGDESETRVEGSESS